MARSRKHGHAAFVDEAHSWDDKLVDPSGRSSPCSVVRRPSCLVWTCRLSLPRCALQRGAVAATCALPLATSQGARRVTPSLKAPKLQRRPLTPARRPLYSCSLARTGRLPTTSTCMRKLTPLPLVFVALAPACSYAAVSARTAINSFVRGCARCGGCVVRHRSYRQDAVCVVRRMIDSVRTSVYTGDSCCQVTHNTCWGAQGYGTTVYVTSPRAIGLHLRHGKFGHLQLRA